jgi:hypothetical protein
VRVSPVTLPRMSNKMTILWRCNTVPGIEQRDRFTVKTHAKIPFGQIANDSPMPVNDTDRDGARPKR